MDFDILRCEDGDNDYINDKLVEYNLSKVPAQQEDLFYGIERKMVDDDGNIIAGCLAFSYCWNIIYIDILWVDDAYRKQGLGSKLLKEVERVAKENGCRLAHLDTFDFQARDFYEKNGYKVFGTLDDCPKDHSRYYMSKVL